jgi:predicted N-formylglutamate amidohydrolase
MRRADRRGSPARRELAIVVSCEHGGHRIPAPYRPLFTGHERVLVSHRGWDPGSLVLARAIARACNAPLVATTISRLLVECNRSIGHPQLFSEFTRTLPPGERTRLLERYYRPHRRAVEEAITRALESHGRVLHFGVHTFTPVLKGVRRRADVGVLYDPKRPFEHAVADALVVHLGLRAPALTVRRNYPYRGWTDGLTTALRARLPRSRYAGVELEVNQALAGGDDPAWPGTRRRIAASFRDAFLD